MQNMEITDFIKRYLTLLGIPENELEESTGKVIFSIISSITDNLPVGKEDWAGFSKKIGEITNTDDADKKMFSIVKDFFSNSDKESLQKEFVIKLCDYLMDMTSRASDSLSEETKKELGKLIDEFTKN